jgi:predicted enzyme related to lactoylglutathione lyase
MPHGKVCYLEIPAMTADASADFYRGIFGWTIRSAATASSRLMTLVRIPRAPNSDCTRSQGANERRDELPSRGK